MNLRKILSAVLALAMLAPAAGCGLAEAASVAVTDMMGREVTLAAPATRVVALTPADCEILYALGAGDTLVGRGEYCDWPAEAQAVPAVQSGMETNVEQIIALQPQVVLMASMAQSEAQVDQLEKAGIRVLVSEAKTIEGVYQAIALIGAVVGKTEEASALAGSMKSGFDALAAKAAGTGKSVYFEVSPLQYGLWTAGAGTFMDEVATMLGLTNIFADVSGWAEVSQEQVIQRNPDYIVTIAMYFGEGPTPEEEIESREGWGGVAAVQNGAILNLSGNELSRPGPRLLDGANMMSDFIEQSLAVKPAA